MKNGYDRKKKYGPNICVLRWAILLNIINIWGTYNILILICYFDFSTVSFWSAYERADYEWLFSFLPRPPRLLFLSIYFLLFPSFFIFSHLPCCPMFLSLSGATSFCPIWTNSVILCHCLHAHIHYLSCCYFQPIRTCHALENWRCPTNSTNSMHNNSNIYNCSDVWQIGFLLGIPHIANCEFVISIVFIFQFMFHRSNSFFFSFSLSLSPLYDGLKLYSCSQ